MPAHLTGFRFRLEPTATQRSLLSRTAGVCRWLWNWALEQRQAIHKGSEGRLKIGWIEQAKQLKPLKAHYPFLREAPHHALQQTLRDLDRAFVNFFEGRAAYPRFRSRGPGDSFRFPDPKQFELDGERVRLPKLGWVRLRLSRPIKGRIRNITVSREGRHWFGAFCCQGDYSIRSVGTAGVGLDAGVARDVTTSEGEVFDLGTPSRRERRRLGSLQRSVSRKQRGSKRFRLAQERAARFKRHLASRRRDLAHKASTRLVRLHAFIAVEDLDLKAMTASAKGTIDAPGRGVAAKSGLNRELLARGHGEFRRMLAYKCERAQIPLVQINPRHTSQRCSRCGHVAEESRRSQAAFRCVACGYELNADHNAALNILADGSAAIARGGSYDPGGSSPGQSDEARTQLRDPAPAGLARNPGQGGIAA
jgi:putative transposase